MKQAIPYYRVSTDRQGKTRLGLEAQKRAVTDFAAWNNYRILDEFTEVESGRRDMRPVLLKALAACKRHNAVLLIAKLDRLGRNVAFISRLMEAKVEFQAVDNPYANKLVVHIMAAFAEHERDQIAKRTKEALQSAKLRGVVLGRFARDVLAERNRMRSLAFAKKMDPLIRRLKRSGYTTIRAITNELNRNQVPTYRNDGSSWHPATVHKVIRLVNQNK